MNKTINSFCTSKVSSPKNSCIIILELLLLTENQTYLTRGLIVLKMKGGTTIQTIITEKGGRGIYFESISF